MIIIFQILSFLHYFLQKPMKKHPHRIFFCLLLAFHGFCFPTGEWLAQYEKVIKATALVGVGFYAGCVWEHPKAYKEGMQEVINKLRIKNYPDTPDHPSHIQHIKNFVYSYKGLLIATGLAITGISYYCRNTLLPKGVLDQLTSIGTLFSHGQFTVTQQRAIGNNIYVGVIEPTALWSFIPQVRTFIVKKLRNGLYAYAIGIRGKNIGHHLHTTDAVALSSLADNIFQLVERTNDFITSNQINLQ